MGGEIQEEEAKERRKEGRQNAEKKKDRECARKRQWWNGEWEKRMKEREREKCSKDYPTHLHLLENTR